MAYYHDEASFGPDESGMLGDTKSTVVPLLLAIGGGTFMGVSACAPRSISFDARFYCC